MIIWIDGDSCPRPVRDILFRASKRQNLQLIFVANRPIPLKKSQLISFVQTSKEEGSADEYILENSVQGDLIITRDIPLAAELVERDRITLNDRGTIFTKENVRERLAQRDFNKMLREAGLNDDHSNNFGEKEIRAFSNAFDRTTCQMLAEESFFNAKNKKAKKAKI